MTIDEVVEAVIKIIKDKMAEGHRFLVFSQFVSALNIVKEELEKWNIGLKKMYRM